MPARKESARKTPAPKKRQTTKASGKAAASKAPSATPKKRKIKDDETAYVAAAEGTPTHKKVATARKQPTPTKPTQQYQVFPQFANGSMNTRIPLTPEESPQEGRLASPNNLQPLGFPYSQQGQQHAHAAYTSTAQSMHDAMGQQNVSPQAQAIHNYSSSPQNLQTQGPTQQGSEAHPLRGMRCIGPGDVVKWLFRNAMSGQHQLLPDFRKLNFRLTSNEIDDVAWVMFHLAMTSTEGNGDLLWRAAAFAVNMSELKLRTLAVMNALPAWWLFRDYAASQMKAQPNWTVDDSAKEILYNTCLQDALKHVNQKQELQKRRGQKEMEAAMAMEQELGSAKVEQ